MLAFVDGDDVIEAFPSKRPDHAFAVRVLPWRRARGDDLVQTKTRHPPHELLSLPNTQADPGG